jgi:hypothetical protein
MSRGSNPETVYRIWLKAFLADAPRRSPRVIYDEEDTVSRHRHPEGSRLPALERNILKYRAFEMMLTLYYAEEIKRFLVNTMKASDHFREPEKKRFPKGVPHYRAVLDKIFEEGHITAAQRDEIIQIVDYRNDIAHELQKMTFDVSRSTFIRSMREHQKPQYDYDILERAKFYRRFLPDKALRRFVSELSFNSLMFMSAEQTYERELKVLRRKITTQETARRAKLGKLQKELKLPNDLPEEMWPYHPANERGNGTLNARGVEVCYRFFDMGKSPLTVAFLMHISKKAINKHYKVWVKNGGKNRAPVELPGLYDER